MLLKSLLVQNFRNYTCSSINTGKITSCHLLGVPGYGTYLIFHTYQKFHYWCVAKTTWVMLARSLLCLMLPGVVTVRFEFLLSMTWTLTVLILMRHSLPNCRDMG